MAMGAMPADIARLILGQGARLTLLGVALGVAAAFAGPEGGFDGLDQISVKLPPALKGSGDLVVKVTAAYHDPVRRRWPRPKHSRERSAAISADAVRISACATLSYEKLG